ncbi:MAG TPA: hypothetical protein VHC90_16355 [Bryobacteraceae bacterium]|nr:hypothetical protein [Bryobacteraceae bacterium]
MHRAFWIGPAIIATVLGFLALAVYHSRLRHVYTERFAESRRERLFLAAVGFFTALIVTRGITIAIHYGIGPFHDVEMHGRHIHHLVWGILLLLLVGYGWLLQIGTGGAQSSTWVGRLMCLVFGVAAALTLDEFALWLNLRDVYWEREGRESLEALALFGGMLAIGVAGKPFFAGIVTEMRKATRFGKHRSTLP